MNKLPKSFAVLNDGSQEFRDIVLPYLNGFISTEALKLWGNDEDSFYGIDKDGDPFTSQDKGFFDTILSLSEFIELSKEVDKMTSEEFLQDYADKKFGKDSYLNKYSFYDVLQIMNAYCEYKTN